MGLKGYDFGVEVGRADERERILSLLREPSEGMVEAMRRAAIYGHETVVQQLCAALKAAATAIEAEVEREK